MASIIAMRPLPAWTLFMLGISLPVLMLEMAAEETARAWTTQIRDHMIDERAEAAADIRAAFDEADTAAKNTFEHLPLGASDADVLAQLNGSPHAFAVGFMFDVETRQLTVVPAEAAATRTKELEELVADSTLQRLAKGESKFMTPGDSSLSFNLDSGPYVTAREIRHDLTVGWIVDKATIEHGAAAHLPNNFLIEPAPVEAEAHVENGVVIGVSFDTAERDPVDAGADTDGGAERARLAKARKAQAVSREKLTHFQLAYFPTTYRVVMKPHEAAAIESFLGNLKEGTFGMVSACLFALVMFAASLFWRARGAQQLADLRTDFVAAVSHELRTPLASVRMFAELLEAGEVAEDERPEVEQALAGETRRLNATLDRMLRFGALARGKLAPQKTKQRIAPILEEAAARAKDTARVEVDPELEANVDGGLIGLALDNLLSNAKKYAPDGGPYQVRARADRKWLYLDVADKGPGLGWRARRLIWKPFERADARLSKATEGSGVGLALVRGIAEAHRGKATVTSAPGQGATFTLRLPRA